MGSSEPIPRGYDCGHNRSMRVATVRPRIMATTNYAARVTQPTLRRRGVVAHAVPTVPGSQQLTPGQILRGHGPDGWKGAGCDIDTTTLTPEMRKLILTYGELAQATYDNLGLDRCNTKTWGNTIPLAPGQRDLLSYLTKDYSLPVNAPAAEQPGTGEMYKLPKATDTLSPLIYALPGSTPDDNAPKDRPNRFIQDLLWNSLLSKVFETVAGLLVAVIDGNNGSRSLFNPDPKTGRGKEPRGAFMGYVAVSEPQDPQNPEVDVAVVWRGTIFREEWESNFAQDELALWLPSPDEKTKILGKCGSKSGLNDGHHLKPWDIGVHDGFDDLYNRCIDQPKGDTRSPRVVVREWLKLLMKENNVTTVSVTGHSLGGGLATICAFGAGDLLDREWNTWDKTGWKTKEKPKVTLISFAAPRPGNYKFMENFRRLGVQALRVVNKGDAVPKVPGVWVQLLSKLVPSRRANIDYDDIWARLFSSGYYWTTVALSWIWESKWGYFHVGQVLEVDTSQSEKDKGDVITNKLPGKHNLEMYMYAVSRLPDPADPKNPITSERNPLLLNKSDDILANKDYPADWWRFPGHRGYKLDNNGRWTYNADDVVKADAAAVVKQVVNQKS